MSHTPAFGLLGRTLGHSYSPEIHAALGNPVYTLFEKEPHQLERFLADPELRGINITIPYKQDVMPYCTRLSDTAKKIGCVNTMVRRPDGWFGHNTDYNGFVFLLKNAGIDVAGKDVLILGDGATSGTIHTVVTDLGAAHTTHVSRHNAPFYEDIADFYDTAQIIINATPVGMYPKSPRRLIDIRPFNHLEGVADVIYNPYRTQLLIDAEEMGIPYSDGLPMLVAQGVYAAELFMNTQFPIERIREMITAMRSAQENIILIGMPGVGKTTIGEALAKETGRPLLDCDAIFEERYEHPSQYIKNHGEPAFRKKETEILNDVCKETGAIIATGGGVITRPENYALLRQNGRIYWIQRPLESLDTADRILSTGGIGRLRELARVRYPLYEAFSQAQCNCTDAMAAVRFIKEEFYEHFNHQRA